MNKDRHMKNPAGKSSLKAWSNGLPNDAVGHCCEVGAEALQRVIEQSPVLKEATEPAFDPTALKVAADVLLAIASGHEVRLRPSKRVRPPRKIDDVERVLAALHDEMEPAKSMIEAFRRAALIDGMQDEERIRDVRRTWSAHWKAKGVEFVPPWKLRKLRP